MIFVATLFQIFDRSSPQEKKELETDALETKKYTTIREILQSYVDLKGGLDFAACKYNDTIYHATSKEQVSHRLLHYRVHRDLAEQTEFYLSLTKEVHDLVKDADSRLAKLDQGLLFRVVYDVEKGGLFYTQISEHCYVVSVTIEQSSMDDNTADLEMRSMVKTIEHYIARIENQ